MKETLIKFTSIELQAAREGRKTQMRRLIEGLDDLMGVPTHICEDGFDGWIAWYSDRFTKIDKREMEALTKQHYPNGGGFPCPYGKPGDILITEDGDRLKIVEVRAERLMDISEGDAVTEGFVSDWENSGFSAVNSFAELWDDIYDEGAFEANPWVWAITFQIAA